MEDFPMPMDDYTKGLMYIQGHDDVPRDFTKAIECFRRAAKQDHAGSQFILGMLLLHKCRICTPDESWDRDWNEAWRWLYRAEGQRFPAAVDLKPSQIDKAQDIREFNQMMIKGTKSIPGIEKVDWWTLLKQMLEPSP